ncbi:cell adhesion molecule CEACAM5 [Pagrus major]|uniref:cell adhesion molecule CEACAM5 n=1 Tax=Pagrus major TaxID=143350 RepID=UPI003CC8587D
MDLLSVKTLLFLLYLTGSCVGQDEILPEGPVDAIVGRNVTLQTLLKNPEFMVMTWSYSDGAELDPIVTVGQGTFKVSEPYQGRVWINQTKGDLTVGPLKPTDSGDYSISVTFSDLSTKAAEIKLRVLEPVSDVAIKSSLAEAIEHNSTVVLTCSAKGSFLKFTWTNGTAPIVADGKRLTLKEEESSSTLTITGVLRTDLVGPIYCTAANKLETEKSAPFNLTVYYGPGQVSITPPNPPPFVQTGSNFSLSCAAVSSPPATFAWYHNNTMMEAGGPVLTLETIEKHRLGKTTGEYTCRATNAKTLMTISSPVVSFSVMDPITGIKVTGPTAVLIAGNSSANISCMAAAGNVMTTTWLKDGKPLAASPRLVFAADLSSLMISMLQKEDNGVYMCQLSNPVNKQQASYKMVVNYGPEPVDVKGDSAVEVNDKVTLTCAAASVPPANFTWKFNGTLTDVKTAEYVIEEAKYKNSGTYTCEANNAVTGKKSVSSHFLSVKEEGALDGLSDGAIAGIVIAVLIALGAAIGLIIWCRQKVPVESPY